MSIPIPKLESHPGLVEVAVSLYVSDRMRAGDINLYSAYLLAHEANRFNRELYIKPAYSHKVHIRTLLRHYYDYLTGTALQCTGEPAESADWFVEAIPLLSSPRKHYLVHRLGEGRALLDDRGFYEILSARRKGGPFADGPFPDEVFPYERVAPERELLRPGSDKAFQEPRELDAAASDFYVQLKIHYEG